MTRLGLLVAAAALALGLVGSAKAAAPRLIMITGEPLAGRVLISGGDEVFELYGSFFHAKPVDRSAAEGRRPLRLGLFWDNALWEPYVREGRLAELRPGQANQVGWFYPAVGKKPALVNLPGYGTWPKTVDETALRILRARGVPVSLDESDGNRVPWVVGGVIGAVLAFLIAGRRFERLLIVRRRLDFGPAGGPFRIFARCAEISARRLPRRARRRACRSRSARA